MLISESKENIIELHILTQHSISFLPKSLNKPESLFWTPAHWQIIDRGMPKLAKGVNNKKPPESYSLVFPENSITPGDGSSFVSQEWDIHRPQSTILSGSVNPGLMGKMGVGGAGNHLVFYNNKIRQQLKKILF